MHAFHYRLAQLWSRFMMEGVLTLNEVKELSESLTANMNWVSKLQRLENLADCAAIVGDREWEEQVCQQMDRLIYVHSPRYR
jgi:hypothetical protein